MGPVTLQVRKTAFVAINLLVFIVVTWIAFARQPYGYFLGIEGNQARLLIEQQSIWFPFGPGMEMDAIVGPGAWNIAINSQMIPVDRLAVWLGGLPLNTVLLYVLLAAELFGSVYALGRTLSLDKVTAIIGSWICCLYSLPYFGPTNAIYTVGHVVPYFVDTTVCAVLFVALFHRLGRNGIASTTARIFGLLVIEFIAAAGYPGLSVVMLPVIFVYMAISLWLATTRTERRLKLVATGILILVAMGSGEASYLLATALHTTTAFFNSEMYNSQAISVFASIFFHSYSYSAIGPALVLASLLGAQRRALAGYGETNKLALASILVTVSLLIVGVLVHRPGSTYTGPKVLFFEYALIPFYALFASDLLTHLTRWVSARSPMLKLPSVLSKNGSWIGVGAIAATVSGSIFLYPARIAPPFNIAQPSPLTDFLQREIGAHPGKPFRGREATFSGFANKPSGRHWFWSDLDILDLEPLVHNEHRFAGLWAFDIPTLQENSEFTSPAVYLVISRLLSRPQDVQTRNFIWFTKLHLPTLRMFGVRFILWDQENPPGTQERAVMHYGAEGEHELKVLEISGANINGYSPTEIIPIKSAVEIINNLNGSFDPSRQVMLHGEGNLKIASPLSQARNAEIVPERGYIRVRAESEGQAVVVIPYEFSHCMEAIPENGTDVPVLTRANLVNTAIGFQGRLDMRLEFRFGPFWPNTCRFEDLLELKRLRINKVPPPR